MIVTEYMENGSLDTFLKVILRSFFQGDLGYCLGSLQIVNINENVC